jgi:hypothetical protein
MNHNDIVNALNTLCPGAQWVLNGDGFAGLTWLDQTQAKPTEDQIAAAIASYTPPPTLQSQVAALQAQLAQLLAQKS